jgi:hypothetical protein
LSRRGLLACRQLGTWETWELTAFRANGLRDSEPRKPRDRQEGVQTCEIE